MPPTAVMEAMAVLGNNCAMVIIKYFEWLKLFPDYREVIYELCTDKFKKIRQISKEEAIEMIEQNHLRKVHWNHSGAIWK